MREAPPKTTTDLDLQALVDLQLDWEEEKRVLQRISSDSALYARYHELLRQKKLLLQWWKSEQEANALWQEVLNA